MKVKILLSALLIIPAYLSAQRIVEVPQGFGTLNNTIAGDTTATGERVDENTIYQLERGGTYLLNGSIRNLGFKIRIHADEGPGQRPMLLPARLSDGISTDTPIRVLGDVELKDLRITNFDELGRLNTRMIRVGVSDVRLTIDNCVLDADGQSAIRLDAPNCKVYITNSIVSNIGRPSDPNNGRVVDTRGNITDTIFVENTTMYNITSRAIRTDGALMKYVAFNNCTFYNFGQRLVPLDAVADFYFTNNIIINHSFYGVAAGMSTSAISTDSLNQNQIDQGLVQNLNILNNNFFLDAEIQDILWNNGADTVSTFNSDTRAWLTATNSWDFVFMEEVTFKKAPVTPIAIVQASVIEPGTEPDWDLSGSPFNFFYDESFASSTRALDGGRLGDRTWTDEDEILSVRRPRTSNFSLYPNPSKGMLTLSAPQILNVERIEILDGTGKRNLIEPYASDMNNLHFEVRGLRQGIYIFRIIERNGTVSNLRFIKE